MECSNFGNLLDNVLEACEAVQDKPDKRIVLTAERFQEIVSVTIESDCNHVRWRVGMPISEKGEIYRRVFPEHMMQ